MKLKIVIALIAIVGFTNRVLSQTTYTWTGATNQDWDNNNNWSSSTGYPVNGDKAVFDVTSANKNCTLDADAYADEVLIDGYQGMLSNALSKLTVKKFTITSNGGSFNGGFGDVVINGTYNVSTEGLFLNGGTFIAPLNLKLTGTVTLAGGTFIKATSLVTLITRATVTGSFNFYNLTLEGSGASGSGYTFNSSQTVDNNMILDAGAGVTKGPLNVTIANNSIITVGASGATTGVLTHANTNGNSTIVNGGFIDILDDLDVRPTAPPPSGTPNNPGFDSHLKLPVVVGTATYRFVGTGNQKIWGHTSNNNINALPNVVINKPSGTLTLDNRLTVRGSSWNHIAGAFTANSNSILMIDRNLLNGDFVMTLPGDVTFEAINISPPASSATNSIDINIPVGKTLSVNTMWVLCNQKPVFNISGGALRVNTILRLAEEVTTPAPTNTFFQFNGTPVVINGNVDISLANGDLNSHVGDSYFWFKGTSLQTINTLGVPAFGLPANKTGAGVLPTLFIEKPAGTDVDIAGQITVDGTIEVSGGDLTGNSTSKLKFIGSDHQFYTTDDGNLIDIGNLEVNLSSGKTLQMGGPAGQVITIKSAVDIQNGSTLYLGSSGTEVRVGGNWTTAGTFNAGNSKVTFNGTATQSLNSPSTKGHFYDLKINNSATPPSGVSIANSTTATVDNTLEMTNGLLNTTATNLLILDVNASSSTVGSSSSYVNGPMQFIRNDVSPAMKIPIGAGGQWHPAELTVTHTNTTLASYTAEVKNTAPGALGYGIDPTIAGGMTGSCYWDIDRSAVANFGGGTIKLYYFAVDNIPNWQKLLVAKDENSDSWWHDKGGTPVGNNTQGTVQSGNFSSFSDFGLGLVDPTLPVTLTNFTGKFKKEQRKVKLEWSTASEQNSDYYEILRFTDPKKLTSIGKVPAAGNSSMLQDYTFDDAALAYVPRVYYRLMQYDIDGTKKELGTISVALDLSETITVFPNPANEYLKVLFIQSGESQRRGTYQITDLSGRVLAENSFELDVTGTSGKIPLNDLTIGTYLILLEIDGIKTVRIISRH